MDINNIKTPGEFFRTAREEGYLIPVQVPHALQETMKLFNVNLPAAHLLLIKMEKLFLIGKVYIIDLSVFKLFPKS